MKGTGRLTASIVLVAALVLAAIGGFVTGIRPLLGLDLVGGVSVVLSGPPGTDPTVMGKALDRIRERVDALGVAEPEISLVGNNIQVSLPGLGGQGKVMQKGKLFCAISSTGKELACYKKQADAQAKAKAQSVAKVLAIIGTTARLEEREVLQVIPPSDPSYKTTPLTPTNPGTGAFLTGGDVVTYQDTNNDSKFTEGVDSKYKLGKAEITGADLKSATAQYVSAAATQTTVTQPGWRVLFTLTKQGTQRFSDVTTRLAPPPGQQTGKQLAMMLYLAFYYRLLGVVTWFGMAIWAVLAIGMVSLLGRTAGYALTLAGVAGIIVSLGITADSYIVFYERLKDEVRHGKSLRAAVVPAFKRSWRTIVAADTVTIIAAAALYILAIGSVKGFALTLGLSTALDMFVVYFFKRPTVFLISRNAKLAEMRGFGLRSGVAAEPLPVGGGER